jgi:4-hydroxybenzoate polyprenyltransferase
MRAVAATFLFLFVLRIVDDVISISEDKAEHPGRALPSGRVPIPALGSGAALLFALALLVSYSWLSLFLILQALYYVGYFCCVKRIPVAIRPLLLNLVFLAVPSYISLIEGSRSQPWPFSLGLFFWLSVVGHDYAHNVKASSELSLAVTAARVLGARGAALVGLVFYSGAFTVGVLSVLPREVLQRSSFFLLGLALLFVRVMFLLIKLVAQPCRARARRLYVSGYAFFLIPSLLLGLDRLFITGGLE